MWRLVRSLRSRHRAMIAHLQKDDSMVSFVPYGAGCFLAGGLLIVSGIAETHPKALAIASQLIQIGWWILQMQGLVWIQWMGGSAYQVNSTFQVWVWTLQLLDVHRRFLQRVALYEGNDGQGSGDDPSNIGPRQYYFNMIARTMLFGTYIVGKLTEWMEALCDWPRSFLTPSSCPRVLLPSQTYGHGSLTHLGREKGEGNDAGHLQAQETMAWMHSSSNLSSQQAAWVSAAYQSSGTVGGGTMSAMVRWVIFETWTGLAVCALMALAWFVAGRVQRQHHHRHGHSVRLVDSPPSLAKTSEQGCSIEQVQ